MESTNTTNLPQKENSGPSPVLGASSSQDRPSLSQLLRDHTEAMDRHRKFTDQKRREVLESVTKVSESMVDGVNRGVSRVFANQKKIEQETKVLEANAAKFSKQANQWNSMINDLSNALKEIGDVENWASVIEADLTEISVALDYINRTALPNQP